MEDLIEANMGLVISIVNSFHPKTEQDREDYIQAGRIGLWKALKKYDPKIGCKFSPYARNPVRWEIIKLINNKKQSHIDYVQINDQTESYIDSDKLWEAIPEYLNAEEKHVLSLKCMGYNFSEICKKIGRGRHYTKRILANILEKMRESNE